MAKTIFKVAGKSNVTKAVVIKKGSGFRPQIRSRHPSHSALRTKLKKMPFRSVIRLGSTTEIIDTIARGGNRVEINFTEAIKNSADKLRMKKCFTRANVATAKWWTTSDGVSFTQHEHNGDTTKTISQLDYPVIAKHRFSSRGRGNTRLENQAALTTWLRGKDLSNYIFEKYLNYNREYRLHVTEDGCFYTCRKMLKTETPKDKRWFRNDSNCVWIVESNPSFNKPTNWSEIVRECVKALNGCNLHVGACDVRVSSTGTSGVRGNNGPNKFAVIEINSAPSFGEGTEERYLEKLPELLEKQRTAQRNNRK